MNTSVARGRVEIRNVAKSYDGSRALGGIDLTVESGEFVSLLGPSGCGKTTLLRCIAGLIAVDSGDIRVDTKSLLAVPAWSRDISVVFQSYALFPHMTVAQNVAFGLRMRRLDKATIARKVETALDLVRMSNFAGRRPAQLSGGQQQRVALARAIVVEPTVLLLDEPLAALDAKLRGSVQFEIRALQARLGTTTILVTHDQSEAMVMSDRIAVMNAGLIEQVSTPRELYHHPASPFVADFVGETNRIHGEVITEGNAKFIMVQERRIDVPLSAKSGTATLMIRPESLSLTPANDSDDGTLNAVVENVVLIGDRFSIFLDAEGISLKSTILNVPGNVAEVPQIGSRVGLSWDAAAPVHFAGVV